MQRVEGLADDVLTALADAVERRGPRGVGRGAADEQRRVGQRDLRQGERAVPVEPAQEPQRERALAGEVEHPGGEVGVVVGGEALEPEVRWIVEKAKPVNHRITGAFRRLAEAVAGLCPGVLGAVDVNGLDATPPRQTDRRQDATRALRARLAATPSPVAPARWQGFALVDTPAGTPARRPRRSRLASASDDPDAPIGRGVLSDDDVAAVALGWLYGCGWSAAEDPAARRPRAARLAHLIAMGRDLGAIRAEVVDLVADGRTLTEWCALRAELVRWLTTELDVAEHIAEEALGGDPKTPTEQEGA